jgi:hypothetical protein
VKNFFKNLLILLALLGAFFALVGVLDLTHGATCNRLDAERVSHLEPGHDTAGPGSIYVKGVGTPQSELMEYLEASAEMQRAGC